MFGQRGRYAARPIKWPIHRYRLYLTPGAEFTITVSGKLTGSPGVEVGANYSGGVTSSGLTVLKQQNGTFYQGGDGSGSFTYRVPVGATKAQIALSGDFGIGTFAIYCYGAC